MFAVKAAGLAIIAIGLVTIVIDLYLRITDKHYPKHY